MLDDPLVEEMALKYGRSPSQISLRHTLQRGAGDEVVLLAKSLTPRRIDENLMVFGFEIGPEDMRALDRLATSDGRSYWDNSDVP